MATILGSLLLKLTGDTADARRSIDQMEKRAKGFSKFIKGAMGIGGAVIAFRALKNIATDLIGTYSVQETAEAKLRSAITATGKEGSISAEKLFDYASELQNVTTYGDEATISAMALLQSIGDLSEDGIKEIMPLVQDLAAGMGLDLEGAASLVAKTLGSTTNALSRYGITIDATAPKEEKLAQLAEEMRNKFGGLSQDLARTKSAGLVQLNNVMGDIKEFGGARLLEILDPITRKMTNLLTRTLETWDAQRKLNKALEGDASTLQDAKDAFQESQLRLNQLNRELETAAARSQSATGQNLKLGGSIRDRTGDLKRLIAEEEEQNKMLYDQMVQMVKEEKVRAAEVELSKLQTDADEDEAEALGVLSDAYKNAAAGRAAYNEISIVSRLTEEDLWKAHQAAEAAIKQVTDAQFNLAESFTAMQMSGRSWSDFLATTMVTAYGSAFSAIGQSLIDAEDGWEAFKEAAKEAVASILEMLGKQLAIAALSASVPLPILFNPVGAAGALAASAAAFIAAGVIRALHEGGDFIVPPGYPNDTYPILVESGERVQVTSKDQVEKGGKDEGEASIPIYNVIQIDEDTLFRVITRGTRNRQLLLDSGAVQ